MEAGIAGVGKFPHEGFFFYKRECSCPEAPQWVPNCRSCDNTHFQGAREKETLMFSGEGDRLATAADSRRPCSFLSPVLMDSSDCISGILTRVSVVSERPV